MNRKYYVALGLLACPCLLIVGVLLVLPPRHRINRDSFERIRDGMTEKEVESILGRPAGDYSSGCTFVFDAYHGPPDKWVWRQPKRWTGDNGSISIYFDDGKVEKTRFQPVFVMPETPLQKFRRWLKL
jgi:hypothetical protein